MSQSRKVNQSSALNYYLNNTDTRRAILYSGRQALLQSFQEFKREFCEKHDFARISAYSLESSELILKIEQAGHSPETYTKRDFLILMSRAITSESQLMPPNLLVENVDHLIGNALAESWLKEIIDDTGAVNGRQLILMTNKKLDYRPNRNIFAFDDVRTRLAATPVVEFSP